MPKAILTFNLPKERAEYRNALYGEDWKIICYAMANYLREKLKYGYTFQTAGEALEETRKFFWECCADSRLDPFAED